MAITFAIYFFVFTPQGQLFRTKTRLDIGHKGVKVKGTNKALYSTNIPRKFGSSIRGLLAKVFIVKIRHLRKKRMQNVRI